MFAEPAGEAESAWQAARRTVTGTPAGDGSRHDDRAARSCYGPPAVAVDRPGPCPAAGVARAGPLSLAASSEPGGWQELYRLTRRFGVVTEWTK